MEEDGRMNGRTDAICAGRQKNKGNVTGRESEFGAEKHEPVRSPRGHACVFFSYNLKLTAPMRSCYHV